MDLTYLNPTCLARKMIRQGGAIRQVAGREVSFDCAGEGEMTTGDDPRGVYRL